MLIVFLRWIVEGFQIRWHKLRNARVFNVYTDRGWILHREDPEPRNWPRVKHTWSAALLAARHAGGGVVWHEPTHLRCGVV